MKMKMYFFKRYEILLRIHQAKSNVTIHYVLPEDTNDSKESW